MQYKMQYKLHLRGLKSLENKPSGIPNKGYNNDIVSKAIYEVQKSSSLSSTKNLIDANQGGYVQLRYSVNVQPSTGERRITVKLIDSGASVQ